MNPLKKVVEIFDSVVAWAKAEAPVLEHDAEALISDVAKAEAAAAPVLTAVASLDPALAPEITAIVTAESTVNTVVAKVEAVIPPDELAEANMGSEGPTPKVAT